MNKSGFLVAGDAVDEISLSQGVKLRAAPFLCAQDFLSNQQFFGFAANQTDFYLHIRIGYCAAKCG